MAAENCKRCARLERRLLALMGRELDLARNSYAVGARLTDEAWQSGDPDGFKEYKRCMEELRK